MYFMHFFTGSVDTKEGWICSYSKEDLSERGFSSANKAFASDEGTYLIRVKKVRGEWVEAEPHLRPRKSGYGLHQ